MTTTALERENRIQAEAGLSLVLINGWEGCDGHARFSAIWRVPTGNSPPPISRWNLSADELRDFHSRNQLQGYRPEHISGYTHRGRTVFAAVLVRTNKVSISLYNLTATTFQKENDARCLTGSTLYVVSAYTIKKMPHFAAVWKQLPPKPQICHHDLTTAQLKDKNEDLYYRGYHIRSQAAYILHKTVHWAVIWNNNAYTPSDASRLDNGPIQTHMAKWQIHGLSLAITYRHRLVYASGFGSASVSQPIPVRHNSLFRIASVSKWLTAVAIMSLIQSGKISLTSRVFGPGETILGTTFTPTCPLPNPFTSTAKFYPPHVRAITVQHLLEHTVGDKGPDEYPPDHPRYPPHNNLRYYLTTYLPRHPLLQPPGTKREYSNFGYVILSMVIERITGTTYRRFVRESLFGNLHPRIFIPVSGALNRTLPNEVNYYKEPYAPPEGNWLDGTMEGAGSWVAEPKSLVRLLAAADGQDFGVSGQKVLERETYEAMTTPCRVHPSYAKGLVLEQRDPPGWVGHNGGMDGTSSWLVRQAGGISYMVVVNTADDVNLFTANTELKAAVDRAVASVRQWPTFNLFT